MVGQHTLFLLCRSRADRRTIGGPESSTDFCNSRLTLQHLSKSTRSTRVCITPGSESRIISQIVGTIIRHVQSFTKLAEITLISVIFLANVHENLPELRDFPDNCRKRAYAAGMSRTKETMIWETRKNEKGIEMLHNWT